MKARIKTFLNYKGWKKINHTTWILTEAGTEMITERGPNMERRMKITKNRKYVSNYKKKFFLKTKNVDNWMKI